jgi:hypothetical protein
MRRVALLVVAALGVIALAVPSQAVALQPTFHVAESTRYAEAQFPVFDETGCLVTFASVFLFSSTGHILIEGERIPVSLNEADVQIVIAQYQLCQAWPTPVWVKLGQATVYRPAFWWDGNGLASARLDAPIPVCDVELATGECIPGTDRSVLVDITWTGVGETTRFGGTPGMNFGLPYYVAIFGGAGAGRSAEVSGSVIDGTTDYATGVAGNGVLVRGAAFSVSLMLGAPPSV